MENRDIKDQLKNYGKKELLRWEEIINVIKTFVTLLFMELVIWFQ